MRFKIGGRRQEQSSKLRLEESSTARRALWEGQVIGGFRGFVFLERRPLHVSHLSMAKILSVCGIWQEFCRCAGWGSLSFGT